MTQGAPNLTVNHSRRYARGHLRQHPRIRSTPTRRSMGLATSSPGCGSSPSPSRRAASVHLLAKALRRRRPECRSAVHGICGQTFLKSSLRASYIEGREARRPEAPPSPAPRKPATPPSPALSVPFKKATGNTSTQAPGSRRNGPRPWP